MGKVILQKFSVLLALLGIILFMTNNEGIGIAAVVLAIILFPLERKEETQQSYYDNDDDDRMNSDSGNSTSEDRGD